MYTYEDTVNLMTNGDLKDRFKAAYIQSWLYFKDLLDFMEKNTPGPEEENSLEIRSARQTLLSDLGATRCSIERMALAENIDIDMNWYVGTDTGEATNNE